MKITIKLITLLIISVVLVIGIVSCEKSDSPPSEISNLKLIEGSYDITLEWVDPKDQDFSQVEIRCLPGIASFPKTIAKGIQTIKIQNLITGVIYNFSIKTIDSNGNESAGIKISGSPDYRNAFVGDYQFENFNHILYIDILNPQNNIMVNDTVFYVGKIEKYSADKLKIVYAPNYIEPKIENESFPMRYSIYGLIYPTVDYTGIMSYPEIPGRYCFTGKFTAADSITFSFSHGTHFGEESYRMFGKKINIE
jgi:hypothetical protein